MVVELGIELAPDMESLREHLEKLAPNSPVKQMKLMEILLASFCLRMRRKQDAILVADSFHKHVRQIIEQLES